MVPKNICSVGGIVTQVFEDCNPILKVLGFFVNHGKTVDVIRRRRNEIATLVAYVINPKDYINTPWVITYTIKRDYIRLTAITYQSFGLDKNKAPLSRCFIFGGDGRDRTDDLLNAIQALSQLSYAPV